MKKPIRYFLYFCIGLMLYFFIGADENPDALNEFHSYAPLAIISVVVLLMIVRYMKSKQEENNEN